MLKPRLEKFYEKIVCEDFILLYNFKNINQVPNFERAVFHSTSNQFVSDKLSLLQSFSALFLESGQRPIKTKAHQSIALFAIRKGNILGLKTTLRKATLFRLLDKLLLFVIPRVISHKKVSCSSLKDKESKNFIISSRDTTYFPEIAELLIFFNILTGFSFDCSLSLDAPSHSQKIVSTSSKTMNKSERFFIRENQNDFAARVTVHAKKNQFVSAFQFPVHLF